MTEIPRLGFTCAYAPLPLFYAAGYGHYRVLPVSETEEQAGHILHDNLCPNIKRILDRAISDDLPELAGVVFINSCDAMRRAADAWENIRRDERAVVLNLPTTTDEQAVYYLGEEFRQLATVLSEWRGQKIDQESIKQGVEKFNEISELFQGLAPRFKTGKLDGGAARLQELYNQASTNHFDHTLNLLKKIQTQPDNTSNENNGEPVYLFGNVMPDPEAFSLIESCNARVAGDDLCTGSRLFSPIDINDKEDIYISLARGILKRPPCARTLDTSRPGNIAQNILDEVKASNAKGVIGHTVKFCDPYLERLPFVREELQKSGIPLLLLEGDCTLRSLGQQKTRIEAFIEMLR